MVITTEAGAGIMDEAVMKRTIVGAKADSIAKHDTLMHESTRASQAQPESDAVPRYT